MKILIILCSGFVIFISASGFLFGQLFFANFEIGATLAGFGGALGGVFAIVSRVKNKNNYLSVLSCIVCIIGVLLDIFDYYSKEHVEGNYYAWFLIGPYIFILLVILFSELLKLGYKSN